jgi:hypothetical protein
MEKQMDTATETIETKINIDAVMESIPPVEVPIMAKVSAHRLHDVLCGALEGGSGYWACIDSFNPAEGKTKADYQFPHLDIIFDGGSITISDCISEAEGCDPEFEPTKLTLEMLQKGLKIMAEKYDWHFKNIVNENDDAETSDVLLQCAVMGDITFG